MKTKKFKPLASLLLVISFCVAIFVVGCAKKDNCSIEPVVGALDDITGTWKQIRAEQVIGGPSAIVEDYSCYKILYSFNKNNVLKVVSDLNDYLGFDVGEHPFNFTKSPDGQIYHQLLINAVEHSCSISDESILTIGLEPKPGPLDLPSTSTTLYFIRTR
jgi:hypothetical protein